MIGEIFFRFHAKLRCVVQMHGLEHTRRFQWFRSDTVVFRLFKVFSLSLQHVWRTYRANIRVNWSKIQLSWVLMLYYPYKTMFSAYKSDCFSMCLRFVCKQSDENHSVHGCPFLAVIFWCFFSVWWLYLEINHSLVAEIICTIYSFIHASTQHNISNKNSFQQCFIFNWSA